MLGVPKVFYFYYQDLRCLYLALTLHNLEFHILVLRGGATGSWMKFGE